MPETHVARRLTLLIQQPSSGLCTMSRCFRRLSGDVWLWKVQTRVEKSSAACGDYENTGEKGRRAIVKRPIAWDLLATE